MFLVTLRHSLIEILIQNLKQNHLGMWTLLLTLTHSLIGMQRQNLKQKHLGMWTFLLIQTRSLSGILILTLTLIHSLK